MPKKRSRLLTRFGMTLVEMAIATAILFVAILPLFFLLNRSIKEVMYYNRSTTAMKLGQELMEEILSMPKWDELAAPGKAIALGSAVLGAETGEPPFDDIDDYNGFVDPAADAEGFIIAGSGSRYHREVEVEYVNVPDDGNILPDASGAPTDFKRIIITVTWPQLDAGFPNRRPVEIVTIVANVDKY
ncbi:MAG: hypothetical protein PHD29_04280 [bacterium]|nr:hypothetical protein [bacterium]MDD5354028.1 hypothetical protein [bacterium]MDD5755981.1 hypothetical protein [bacterium]